jgi:hypothetical protein
MRYGLVHVYAVCDSCPDRPRRLRLLRGAGGHMHALQRLPADAEADSR